jgi:rubrerythrin
MPDSQELAAPLDQPRTPEERSSRRNLLRGLGLGSAGALAVVLSACGGDDDDDTSSQAVTSASPGDVAQKAATKKDARIPGTGDLQIVNYALTLEYLEADFYAQVIDSGVVTDKKLGEMVKLFGEQEQTHVEALEKTAKQLGKAAGKPKTDFEEVLGAGPAKILETAATVENLGAAAYLGQAARIKDPDILAAALSIHTVEARHAAALNRAAGLPLAAKGGLQGSLPDGAFATPLSMKAVLKRVQPFLA